jgi:hypothetical protein
MKTGRKRLLPLSAVVVLIVLAGVCLVGGAPQAGALSMDSQPTNTPSAPGGGGLVSELPPLLAEAETAEASPDASAVAEDVLAETDGAYALRAQAQLPSGVGFSGASPGGDAVTQNGDVICMDLLSNPQMDVDEHGDGTATIWDWVIMCQKIYYDDTAGYYQSPSYSLVMVDEADGSDTSCVSGGYDYDFLGQAFTAPAGLLTVTVRYSRLYANPSAYDTAFYELYTLDSQGNLDQWVTTWNIGESPSGWSNRSGRLTDPTDLALLSGKDAVVVFGMKGSMGGLREAIWLDDAQVEACIRLGGNKAYVPLTAREEPVDPPPPPCCDPREPDSKDERGSLGLGCACGGAFGPTDTQDYYSLVLNGTTSVRLWLANMPSGTNFGAAIYEDLAGGQKDKYVCHIGEPGSQNKFVDCSGLSSSKDYYGGGRRSCAD